MVDLSSQHTTRVLVQSADRDANAAARLLPLVYEELRLIARKRMAAVPPGNTLTPTALVHEAYVKLTGTEHVPWENRKQFFVAASRAMRNILVDQTRRKAAKKNGGGRKQLEFNEIDATIEPPGNDVLALDEALSLLEDEEPEAGEVVILLHFAGLTTEEVARVLRVSSSTIKRRWRFARAWLHRALSSDETDEVDWPDGH